MTSSFTPITPHTSSEILKNEQLFRQELLVRLGEGSSSGPSTTDTLLTNIKDAIDAILPLIDGLELITGNIQIESGQINLQTDAVEQGLTNISQLLDPSAQIDQMRQAVEQAIANGTVTIDNFPATQAVEIAENTSTTIATRTIGYATASAANGAVPLSATPLLVESVILQAVRNNGNANSSSVFVGDQATQLFEMRSRGVYSESATDGKKLDLNQIYVRIQNVNDGIVWIAVN